jgi:hypothetical protein
VALGVGWLGADEESVAEGLAVEVAVAEEVPEAELEADQRGSTGSGSRT